MQNILERAYAYTDFSDQAMTPEMAVIRYIFISPEVLTSIGDSELFLAFIENIVKERYNVSFPENTGLCQQYIADCVSLKNAMKKNGVFDTSRWLSYTIRLLENVKTPYYDDYSKCLFWITTQIHDPKIADRLLGSVYSLVIKSQKKQLRLITKIAEAVELFKKIPGLSDELLCEIITENLTIFGQEKSFWTEEIVCQLFDKIPKQKSGMNLMILLQSFLQQELEFTKSDQALYVKNFGEYLALRALWMLQHKKEIPNDLFGDGDHSLESQFVDSEFLNTYAYNMNETSYVGNPAIGREKEINELSLILISPKKSPILLGDAGVGKTSVVEGLAWNLKNGMVPDLLRGKKIYKLTTSALLSDTKYVGEMEARMKQLTGELKDHPEVILFIDEIHTIVGAGSTESSNNDIANMLKPYIDRGEIKLIGATTKAEYDQFMAGDKALSRRFYPIYIEEPDIQMTLQILEESIPMIEHDTRVRNAFDRGETRIILKKLIEICDKKYQIEETMQNRPELPLTLLEMAFSYAALESRDTFSREDLVQAVKNSSCLKSECREQFTL